MSQEQGLLAASGAIVPTVHELTNLHPTANSWHSLQQDYDYPLRGPIVSSCTMDWNTDCALGSQPLIDLNLSNPISSYCGPP